MLNKCQALIMKTVAAATFQFSTSPATVPVEWTPTSNARGTMARWGFTDPIIMSHDRFLIDNSSVSAMVVADFGTGNGETTVRSAIGLDPASRILAYDMSEVHLQQLRETATTHGVENKIITRVGTMPDLEFPDIPLDGAAMFRSLHFLKPHELRKF